MKTMTATQLLELAIVKLHDGAPECALVFALRAVNRASEAGDDESRRRALNIASNSCLMGGTYADAIDYGLQAAAVARLLRRDDALVNALLNVTAALVHIGRYEETVAIACNVANRFANRFDCIEDTRQLLTNAAGAQLASEDFSEAIRYCKEAIDLYCEVSDEASARSRLIDELNWMKAAIASDRPETVDARFKFVNDIVAAYPTPYHTCNLRFAKALYAHYSGGQTVFAMNELESLLDATQGFSTIHVDVLQWLVRLGEQSGDIFRTLRESNARLRLLRRQPQRFPRATLMWWRRNAGSNH
jgi:tetratricopeptide (TPR) repeat protein